MKIGIDVRDLQIAQTGTKTYLEELCKAFPVIAPNHEFLFLQPKWRWSSDQTKIKKILKHIVFYWWKEIQLPWIAWRNKCSLIFCTDYVVPLIAHCPTIPVFHGANFWEIPQNYNRFWRLLLNILALPAARKSPAIITDSEFSRHRLSISTNLPIDKIKIAYLAPKGVTRGIKSPFEMRQTLEKYQIDPGKPFILHVGVLDKRKNLPRLIQAFSQSLSAIGDDFQLIIVGGRGNSRDLDDSWNIRNTIHEYKLENKVIMTGYVPDNELPVFYQTACFYAFPSLYEGFGLPALEAFVNRLPLIASNVGSLPEIVGDAAIKFDPRNVEDITQAIVLMANREELRNEYIDRGSAKVAEFSWENTARTIINIFEDVTDENGMT